MIPAVALIVVSMIAYRKDVRIKNLELSKRKTDVDINDRRLKHDATERLLDFISFNQIRESVDRIFAHTSADKFGITIAVNGTTDFKTVSVIYEQRKSADTREINALVRYRDVYVDDGFREMLKQQEHMGPQVYNPTEMADQLAKNILLIDGVKHMTQRFLHREKLDDKNDVVIHSSVSSHQIDPFTDLELTIIKGEYESHIIKVIKDYI